MRWQFFCPALSNNYSYGTPACMPDDTCVPLDLEISQSVPRIRGIVRMSDKLRIEFTLGCSTDETLR